MTVPAASQKPSRPIAILEALGVTLIWGSSFVIVKFALEDIGPLMLAGLRYTTAFLILLPFAVRRKNSRRISRHQWIRLALIGLSAYCVGNGSLFWGLKYLPATTSSFLMSLIPLFVLVMAVFWLREYPGRLQIAGLVLCLLGCGVFFARGLKAEEPTGLAITGIGLVAFAAFSILGREVARSQSVGTLALTTFPLGFGGATLLVIALLVEGLPHLTPVGAGIILWLAVINTAVAYLLYNHSLQTLTALEMNLMLNLSPFATALIAILALGETLHAVQYAGMVVGIIGIALAQRQQRPPV